MLKPSFIKIAGVLLGSLMLVACAANADDLSRDDVEQIVRDYILENPEIISDAIHILQERAENEQAAQQAAALTELQGALFTNDLDPIGGNPDGSLTLVEFFDYNCGYCKRSNSVLQALIADNPNLRVVYKEWPILSETSALAARVALAVNLKQPEYYEALHRAFLEASSLRSEKDVWNVVKKVGADRAIIEPALRAPEVEQHLQQTSVLAQQLGITGTPAFIVGDQVLKGAYPQEQIQQAIDSQS
ncbi:DsbA family protein [Reinekea blandensis]|uniref:27kDa outer membrane protein n=1 Tax=Reinekea blandensis MED297 TaxID=314283 RepID=A4BAB0_9GAMM|nr:DsbA family protein [Reinekea blandensis]EAR10866.1 27kDa outer membrane protein [Reinekea sp. MED297] [Reinekea blandensis MED297]